MIYSRNVARRQICASEFAQLAFPGAKCTGDVEKGPRVFLEIEEGSVEDVSEPHHPGRHASDYSTAYANLRESNDLGARRKKSARSPIIDDAIVSGPHESSAHQKKDKDYGLCLFRYGGMGGINYRSPSCDTKDNISIFHMYIPERPRNFGSPNVGRSIRKDVNGDVGIFWDRAEVSHHRSTIPIASISFSGSV